MKKTFRISFISCIAGFALPAFAAEQPITDVGTLDETSAKEAFPAKPPYPARKFNRWSVAPQPAFAWCENISAYAIGGVAAFWLIERTLIFVA